MTMDPQPGPSGMQHEHSARLSHGTKAQKEKELYCTVEVHLPKPTKPQLTRSKTDRRGDHRQSLTPNDLSRRKVKEKPSWMSLSKTSNQVDIWRPATCKLVEEEEGLACTLNVYVDETNLYISIKVQKLLHTDIRRVHHSVYGRKNCLRIFVETTEQVIMCSGKLEPICLSFPDSESLDLWMALLRSYAVPEIYGRSYNSHDGGLYRMWRQVCVQCQQGRDLGSSRPIHDDGQHSDYDSSMQIIDMDVYCELYVNDYLSGRTTTQKGIGSPDWGESFLLEDLSPFQNLEIVVFRDKRLGKATKIGSVVIPLMNFRRGEWVDGWFPVLADSGHAHMRVGELKLKLKVDEEIILPLNIYARVLDMLLSRNLLEWIEEFKARWKLEHILEPIQHIALSKNILLNNFKEMVDREVEAAAKSSHIVIFRVASPLTKSIESFMKLRGQEFLNASVGASIRRIVAEKVVIDVSSRNSKSAERNMSTLIHWCEIFWKAIYDARTQCPSELRVLFAYIRQQVETGLCEKVKDGRELSWQSVSSFLFLRYLCPAILYPNLYHIWPGMIEEPVKRSLTEIAKVLQSLANLSTGQNAHPAAQEFLAQSYNAMVDYILVVSSPESLEECNSTSGKTDRQKSRALSVLRYRATHSPPLFKDAIPVPPQMHDISKQLAIVNTLVVRHARRNGYPIQSDLSTDRQFNELCSRCFEVEERALQRVSQLAKQPKPRPVPAPTPLSPRIYASPPIPTSPSDSSFQIITPPRQRKISVPGKQRRSKRTLRPATAPSQDDSDPFHSHEQTDVSVPSSPTAGNGLTRIFSRTSISSKQSIPSPKPMDEIPDRELEPRSLPSARPAFMHHPRSTSTDSALVRKHVALSTTPTSPTITSSYVEPGSPDGIDDMGKRKKGILGRLTRR